VYTWQCLLQFDREEDAEKAVEELNNRWFNGRPVHAELSPVTDFREACCRQYEMGSVFVTSFTILCPWSVLKDGPKKYISVRCCLTVGHCV